MGKSPHIEGKTWNISPMGWILLRWPAYPTTRDGNKLRSCLSKARLKEDGIRRLGKHSALWIENKTADMIVRGCS